jgi:hypothetical protein
VVGKPCCKIGVGPILSGIGLEFAKAASFLDLFFRELQDGSGLYYSAHSLYPHYLVLDYLGMHILTDVRLQILTTT